MSGSFARDALRLMRERGGHPKKSLGQNFLLDDALCRRIAEAALPVPGGTVLEIGPGVGALTHALLERADRVVAIERDETLCALLGELFGPDPRLQVIAGDATALAWAGLLEAEPAPRYVAGNLPYSVTGALVERLVEAAPCLEAAAVMVQREVADRMLAAPGSRAYGMLSVFVQAALAPSRVTVVRPGAFFPAPTIDSTVLKLLPLHPPRAVETPAFRHVVRSAFGQRRKTLRNAWRALGLAREELERLAQDAGVSLDARAETLDVEAFARVAELFVAGGRAPVGRR